MTDVEALVEILRQFIVATDYYGPSRNAAEAFSALGSLTAALERAERENVEMNEHYQRKADEAGARAEKAERVVEAARDAERWLVVPSDVPEQHHEVLGRARRALRAALAAYDAKESE